MYLIYFVDILSNCALLFYDISTECKYQINFLTIKIFYSITGSVIFESKVSALFWAVYLEEFSAEVMSTVVPSAQYLYEELMLTPYMARFVVLHKPHSPHAWCDSLRVICVTDDKAEVRKVPIFFNYLFTF